MNNFQSNIFLDKHIPQQKYATLLNNFLEFQNSA